MAVLIEAISVVVRRDSIDEKYPGGWPGFLARAASPTLCFDDQLVRLGFLSSNDVGRFIEHLQNAGLVFMKGGFARDFVIVDQLRGPTTSCNWIETGRISYGDSGGKIRAAWMFEGERRGAGLHMSGDVLEQGIQISAPDGWEFEGSVSDQHVFVPTEEADSRLEFVRDEDGLSVYRDRETGELVYGGKTD